MGRIRMLFYIKEFVCIQMYNDDIIVKNNNNNIYIYIYIYI